MSSRALRKLQKDQGLAHLAETLSSRSDEHDDNEESDAETETVTASKPAKNLFDLVSYAFPPFHSQLPSLNHPFITKLDEGNDEDIAEDEQEEEEEEPIQVSQGEGTMRFPIPKLY